MIMTHLACLVVSHGLPSFQGVFILDPFGLLSAEDRALDVAFLLARLTTQSPVFLHSAFKLLVTLLRASIARSL